MLLYIIIYNGTCLTLDFFGNQTTAHPVPEGCAAASLAIPSLMGE